MHIKQEFAIGVISGAKQIFDRFIDAMDRMHRNDTGIAYGVSLAVITIFLLIVCWITLAPCVDGLRDVTVDLNANDPTMFSNDLVSRVNNIYNIWGYIVFSFVAVPFLYVIVRAIRQQSLQE